MQLTTSCLAAILALTSFTTASPLNARATSLKDWEVFGISVGTPSGRPGSYPWATITANITDPNQINLGPATDDGSVVIVPAGSQGLNCQAKWFTKGDSPVGRTWPCDPVGDGYWTLQVLDGEQGFSTTNFRLKFTHVADLIYHGSEYTASYQAQGLFKVGDNLAGQCGGSGVCNWGLAAGKNPVKIKPTKL